MKAKNSAFTLVELIVVITILAVLGTISFLSFQGYTQDSRNVVRVNDFQLIKKGLELFSLDTGSYPVPDQVLDITYSGGLLWKQGYFQDGVRTRLGTISKVSYDPLFNESYTYSTMNNGRKYQLAGMVEGGGLSYLNQTHALGSSDVVAYVVGSFDLLDVKSQIGGICKNITAPSLILNNPPGNGILLPNTQYKFVYNEGKHIPSNLGARLSSEYAGSGYTIDEVYNKCSVESLSDINTYITNLSAGYQQFSNIPEFDEVSNHSRTLNFIKLAIAYLEDNGIFVPSNILSILDNAFMDSFTGVDNDILVSDHVTDTLGTWEFITPSTDSGSYVISGNTLEKGLFSSDLLTPVLLKPQTTADSTTSVKIVDFNGGSVTLYARYLDANNYYSVIFTDSGHSISKNDGGTISGLPSTPGAIMGNSTVQLIMEGNYIKVIINGIEVDNNYDVTPLLSVGNNVLFMDTVGTKVDDYSLYFE